MPDRVRQLLRVLRHREFRLLWGAHAASVIGDRIVVVALALFVSDLTGSATDVGLVLAAYGLPLVAFLLVGGVVADRMERHRLMVLTDLVRFALHALLAVLILTGAVAIWQLVAIGLVFGTAEAFFRPAASGLLPQTVPEDEVQEASALTSLFSNLAEFSGPALATALVLGVDAGAAFAIDAATFLVSALLLVRMRPRTRVAARGAALADRPHEPAITADAAAALIGSASASDATARLISGAPEHDGATAGGMLAEIRDGYREVRARTWVWATLAAFCVALLALLVPWFVVGPIIAEQRYGSIAVFGVVTAVFGAGTVAGSLVAIRWRPLRPLRLGMLLTLPWPLGIALYAAGAPLVAVVPIVALSGIGLALFDVWWVTALAERIAPDRLSRVTAYDWMVSFGLVPFGYVVAGPLAGAVGASTLMLAGAALGFGALALGTVPRETRALERLDDAPPLDAPAAVAPPPVSVA